MLLNENELNNGNEKESQRKHTKQSEEWESVIGRNWSLFCCSDNIFATYWENKTSHTLYSMSIFSSDRRQRGLMAERIFSWGFTPRDPSWLSSEALIKNLINHTKLLLLCSAVRGMRAFWEHELWASGKGNIPQPSKQTVKPWAGNPPGGSVWDYLSQANTQRWIYHGAGDKVWTPPFTAITRWRPDWDVDWRGHPRQFAIPGVREWCWIGTRSVARNQVPICSFHLHTHRSQVQPLPCLHLQGLAAGWAQSLVPPQLEGCEELPA